MKIVDRINRFVLERMGRDGPAPRVVGDALVLGGGTVPLADLSGAVAHEIDVHAGALLALTLVLADGRRLTVTQEEECWEPLLAALDRLRLTGAPSRDWTTAVLAEGPGRPPRVLRRDGRPAA